MENKKNEKQSKKNGFVQCERHSWKCTVNIILISIIFILTGLGIRQAIDARDETRDDRTLQILLKIDNLAHIQFSDMEERESLNGFTGAGEFIEIDNGFHNASSLRERFEQTKKMDNLFDRMDEYLHRSGCLGTDESKARDKEYHETHDTFMQLQGEIFNR